MLKAGLAEAKTCELKVGTRVWSSYSINNVQAVCALADDQCLGFIFAISAGGWVRF